MKMLQPNDPAFPQSVALNEQFGISSIEHDPTYGGLNIRADLAARAMQGILANRWTMEHGGYSADDVAKLAIEHADALINDLNAEK